MVPFLVARWGLQSVTASDFPQPSPSQLPPLRIPYSCSTEAPGTILVMGKTLWGMPPPG